ncbi:polar amino acid transport system substrate-binding protein [Pseudomonas flavescens]|uniref:Polar amino acid transport system substrate-binding protein n=1 Tax=Phytopseudomonas flavescens TaxID=29435 RepID=A0A1G8IXP0_9GAMM|nr:ABC transporter substrate-binding protein [Pseudomonas flavescens]SDI23701.1 polar amino acid transport system substrate-binding protein [Pseudomonas flavescens]
MSTLDPSILADLAPTGVLRAAINYGNPVLAQRGADGQPAGASTALAKALAEQLNVGVEFVTFDAAGKVFAALGESRWDLAFLAIEPVRAAEIDFSHPYVIIEGTYLVRDDSPFQTVAELDRPGLRLAVGKGAAYDLFLTRTLDAAELVRAPTSAAAVDWFLEQRLDAAAGVRQPLEDFAARNPGYRVLADSFTEIRQAMAVPKGRDAGVRYVREFLEERIRSGFVAEALHTSGQQNVRVGPALGEQ